MSQQQVVHAYRHLYRAALQAVCYSQPASTVVRHQLRGAFRAGDAASFDERAIKRTIWFLKNAARSAGVEHRIVRNMLMVRWFREQTASQERPSWKAIAEGKTAKRESFVADTAYLHYEKTIDMLNRSMGLCLPVHRNEDVVPWTYQK